MGALAMVGVAGAVATAAAARMQRRSCKQGLSAVVLCAEGDDAYGASHTSFYTDAVAKDLRACGYAYALTNSRYSQSKRSKTSGALAKITNVKHSSLKNSFCAQTFRGLWIHPGLRRISHGTTLIVSVRA